MVKIYILDLKKQRQTWNFYGNISDIGRLPPQKNSAYKNDSYTIKERTAYLVVYNVFNYWVDHQLKALSSAKGY